MVRRANPLGQPVPPTIPPRRALELLRGQLSQAGQILKLRHRDPQVEKWKLTTESILNAAFGKPDGEKHDNTLAFLRCYCNVTYGGMPEEEYDQNHVRSTQDAKAVLESCIEQLEMLAPPAAQAAPGQYRFHPEIERVSGDLFRDGHYKQSALEAYIRVIDEVKRKSGLNLDGDPLMNRAFGCDNQTPVIRFNSLQTDAERDEQKGFMYLFKGIVALRNSKAHSNTLFNDPYRANDYLALASLLMRVMEIATINRP